MVRHDPAQGSLFGEPPDADTRRRESRPVAPATPSDDLVELASRLPGTLRMGTSSWAFPGWEGIVYDRRAAATRLAREGLEAYARHPLLRAVGIDRTYYAPVGPDVLAGYAAAVPEDFLFLVKAWEVLTTPFRRDATGRPVGDNPTWLDPVTAAEAVVAPFVEGLGRRGGALLFQFPPQGRRVTAEPRRFAGRLHGFLTALPEGPPYAVELRDRELLEPDVVAAVRECGATPCLSLHPRLPAVAEQARRLGVDGGDGPLVARWMLHPTLAYDDARERYAPFDRLVDSDPASRGALAELCLGASLAGRRVIVIVNNKAEGSAPQTIFALAREIDRRRQPG